MLAESTDPVVTLLRSQPDDLYGLLDAARGPKVLGLLKASGGTYQSLYEGPKGEELAEFAPYLVRLSRPLGLLEHVIREGWGQSWGVLLTSSAYFADVRRHFRRFLLVKLEDGREAYFRFYDPRVLRTYLPTCNSEEVATFFGPVGSFLVEAERATTVLKLTPGPHGLRKEHLATAVAPAPAPAWTGGSHVAPAAAAVPSF